ncbi:hypothetical protein [Nitrospina gracilis]|uniref:hypothetical protein n=1 Tax=Nitrospina gracilis TaxID=35801 RepID=UPI001F3C0DA8|nr:hypothetical protein [Nitrospina gracilis]MCF8719763.1 hypothetical protein [Nitrospina gracilis Nb-211]
MASELWMDPGFVHHRKIQSLLGDPGMQLINSNIAQIPSNTPDWQKEVQIDHIYTKIMIAFCQTNEFKTLEEVLLDQNGHMFCSIVKTENCSDIYESKRVKVKCLSPTPSDLNVELHITTSRIRGDTLKSRLYEGTEVGVIAQFFQREGNTLIFEPLIIGLPMMVNSETREVLWELYTDYYRIHLEDFDEFSKVKEIDLPKSFDEMKKIREKVFKQCLGKILSETIQSDWGGETSDLYTSHLHINGTRVTAAFALKGRSKFRRMRPRDLGQNGDQIARLSKEPAQVLIIQHCHDIDQSVEEQLKVYATQPYNPRRYCLIDGRESLRLLNAYNLTEWAIRESKNKL